MAHVIALRSPKAQQKQITDLQEHRRASGREIGAQTAAVPSNGQNSLGQNVELVLGTMTLQESEVVGDLHYHG